MRCGSIEVRHRPLERLVTIVAYGLQCSSFRLSDYAHFMTSGDEPGNEQQMVGMGVPLDVQGEQG
jgi:hypothetical protein